MSIKAIIYSKFDPQEGPKIVHQVPEESVITQTDITSSTINNPSALLSFSTISRFLIPRQSLCGNLISLTPPLLTPSTPPTHILSHPICLKSSHYPRNEFIFNFALVLSPPDAIDIPSYKSVVTKLAHLMQSLEEQSHFLSDDNSPVNSGKIYSLCETLMEDLNNYAECMIPIDNVNTLNIKLFPTLPNPASVKAWHVPLFTVRIETLMDENWDLTMQRIIPYINGVNSVKRIATLADADLKLTKKCLRHLLYYGCILLLDIFSFNAIYAPTPEFTGMIAGDWELQAECARYVNTAFEPGLSKPSEVAVGGSGLGDIATSLKSSTISSSITGPASNMLSMMSDEDYWPQTAKGDIVDGVGIVQLFANLRQGLTVREWYAQNSNMLANIDVRRFVTFGVIKGFLYRVHRYAIQTAESSPAVENGGTTTEGRDGHRNSPRGGNRGGAKRNNSSKETKSHQQRQQQQQQSRSTNQSAHKQTPPRQNSKKTYDSDPLDDTSSTNSTTSEEDEDHFIRTKLIKFLDGTHCFDEICTELNISERELMDLLARPEMGEVVVICR